MEAATGALPTALIRPQPDEELTPRVLAVRASRLCEGTLDLSPGLLLFGVAEPNHQLPQGKRPSRVPHSVGEKREAPSSQNLVDGYLSKAGR